MAEFGKIACSHHKGLTVRGPALFDRRRILDHRSGSTGNALILPDFALKKAP
jgi:hypothetical protein